ncbi:glycosyltransferase [Candidatus Dependentiae bacterium]|nr:glycosyltransferase [Candidatus Dependentiae bacterium]
MKILEVVHNFLPYNLGGTEIYTFNISKEFQRLGNDVHVFTHYSDTNNDEYNIRKYLYEGLEVFSINYNYKDVDSYEKTYKNEKIDAIFKDYINNFKPDFIHFQHLTNLSVNLINIARDMKILCIATIADYWYLCQRGQLLKNDLKICGNVEYSNCVKCFIHQLKGFDSKHISSLKKSRHLNILKKIGRKLLRLFPSSRDDTAKYIEIMRVRFDFIVSSLNNLNLIIAPSNFLREKYIQHGVDPDKIIYSDYGFTNDKFRFKTVQKINYPVKFGFIGTIIPPKGLHNVIEAFPDKTEYRAIFKIHGINYSYYNYETYFEDLKKAAAEKNITFEGKFENSEVNNLLLNLDVLIVPSIWYENSPLTIHEAFLSGLPVITSDQGGMAELVEDGKTGLHFKLGDSGSIREIIQKIIDKPEVLTDFNNNIRNAKIKSIEENALEILNKVKEIGDKS